MNLYVVTVAGNRLYFSGELTEKECEIVEKICNGISCQTIENNAEKKLEIFKNSLDRSLMDKIEFAEVKYVFRI